MTTMDKYLKGTSQLQLMATMSLGESQITNLEFI